MAFKSGSFSKEGLLTCFGLNFIGTEILLKAYNTYSSSFTLEETPPIVRVIVLCGIVFHKQTTSLAISIPLKCQI